jgi:hypothetical protein
MPLDPAELALGTQEASHAPTPPHVAVTPLRHTGRHPPGHTQPWQLVSGFLLTTNRGDWTPLELFLNGIRGWEAGLRRRIDDRKPLPSGPFYFDDPKRT